MSIYQVLQSTGLPCAYSHFKKAQSPPYIVYIGNDQDTFSADNTYIWKRNRYQVEYYYKRKDESAEDRIETTLLENGYQYDKSEDLYLEDQDVFLIYYYI